MRTLSADATLVTRRVDADPRYLLTIEFTDPVPLTLRLADQTHVSLLGHEWQPFVLNWGTIDEALNAMDLGGRPAVAEITLANDKPIAGRDRLSDLIRTPFNQAGYEWAFAKVTVTELLDAAHGIGDERIRGVFYLEEPTAIREDALTLTMSDETLLLAQRNRFVKITTTMFPDADPDVVGQTIPVVFGSVTGVPCKAIVAGYATTLDGSLTSGATTVTVDDAGTLVAGDTIMIGTEHITLGTRVVDTFTGCTRGANSTTAAAHDDDAPVYRVRSGTAAYRYAVALSLLGGIQSITNIRVNGEPANTSPTITYADSTYGDMRLAIIDFTPSNVRLFHIMPISGIEPITVAQLQHNANGGILVTGSRTITPTTGVAEIVEGRNTRTLDFTMSWANSTGATSWLVRRRIDGGSDVQIAQGVAADLPYSSSDTRSYDTTGDEIITIGVVGTAPCVLEIDFDSYSVQYEGAGGGSGNSTAAAVIGEVTCDVAGIQDDNVGTVSGVPQLLLSRPADVIKAVLVGLYGVDPMRLGASWAQTRARHVAMGYTWAALLTTSDFGELRQMFAEQCRSGLFLDGDRWHLKFLEVDPAPDTSIDYDRATVGGQPAEIARSPRTDLRTRITAYADRDWAVSGRLDEQYRRVTLHEDLAQPGLAEPLPYDLELAFVRDARTAQDLGDYWLTWWKRQRFQLELEGFWNLTAIEKYDHLTIENHPLLEAHGGTRLVWRVVGKRQHDDGRIGLSLVEANR